MMYEEYEEYQRCKEYNELHGIRDEYEEVYQDLENIEDECCCPPVHEFPHELYVLSKADTYKLLDEMEDYDPNEFYNDPYECLFGYFFTEAHVIRLDENLAEQLEEFNIPAEDFVEIIQSAANREPFCSYSINVEKYAKKLYKKRPNDKYKEKYKDKYK